MGNQGRTIAGLAAGAGLMYLLDPDRGARRRALVRDQAARARHRLAEGAEATGRDLGAIEVSVTGGRVTLQGHVLERELDDVLRTVRGVRGVAEVRNELGVRATAEGVPSLQGGRRREAGGELAQETWAPAIRCSWGRSGERSPIGDSAARALGPALVAVGGALVARALTTLPASRLTGIGAGPRAIDVQKAIHVDAPVERVWERWRDIESWPLFMSHLKEVRGTSEGRSHWVALGPAGTAVEWDAETTGLVPNETIPWRSVEGSSAENTGRVRFQPDERGGTRIEIRISYNPPGGAIGHTVASLFGVDPARAMDEDMVRLKSLLEEGKASAGEGQVRLEELRS